MRPNLTAVALLQQFSPATVTTDTEIGCHKTFIPP